MFCTLCVSWLSSRHIADLNNFSTGTEKFQQANLKLHAGKHHVDDMTNLTSGQPIVTHFKHQASLEKSRIQLWQ